jgi:hypothetical protein
MGNLSSVCKHSATAPKDNDGVLAMACTHGECGFRLGVVVQCLYTGFSVSVILFLHSGILPNVQVIL